MPLQYNADKRNIIWDVSYKASMHQSKECWIFQEWKQTIKYESWHNPVKVIEQGNSLSIKSMLGEAK
jgi:hypothetical protein